MGVDDAATLLRDDLGNGRLDGRGPCDRGARTHPSETRRSWSVTTSSKSNGSGIASRNRSPPGASCLFRRRTRSDGDPDPGRDHPLPRPGQRALRRRRVRYRRRPAIAASSIRPRRATGWRNACCSILEIHVMQDRYIATTQIGISVASLGLGMYGEHWLAECDCSPVRALRRRSAWIAVAHRRQRHRGRHAHLPAHRDRRDGAQGAGAAAGATRPFCMCRRSSERCSTSSCRSSSSLNGVGNRLLAPGRHRAARGRARALSHRRGAPVHRPREPGRRAAARRVRTDPARPLRVRRSDGR